MPELVIKGATVVDASGARRADVVVDDEGFIAAVGADLTAREILDAEGCVITPGLVDLRTRLGEPGREQAETIESATRSAVLGGFTTVVATPDTDPVVDNASVVRDVRELARDALCRVEVAGAITRGLGGESLADLGEMAHAGVKLFSDAGVPIEDSRLLRRAMEYVVGLDATLAVRCEDRGLASGGHMHEGAVSARLGIPAIPAEAEELAVMRAVILSRLTGGRVHVQSLSTAGSVGIVRAAKSQGLQVTADVTPNHLTLTDESVAGYDARFKLAPPLRSDDDVANLRSAVADGSIDAIATDHWGHEPQDKEMPFDEAPAGVVGLETALGIALSRIDLDLASALALLSWRPAAIAGAAIAVGGVLARGQVADLTIVDPTAEWVVAGSALASRSTITPFEGMRLKGRVRHTIVGGEAVVIDGEAQR